MERRQFIESENRIIVETVYDAQDALDEAKRAREIGGVHIGSKGQRMELACVIPLEHITALKNQGYDLLSPDPDKRRAALVYIQSNQQQFMATDKKVFAKRRTKWQ